MIVAITAPAVADLREIYIAEDSPLLADKIVSEWGTLASNCRGGPNDFLTPRRLAWASGAVHKRYLIFYRVGKSVEVLRIIHGARNYEAMLADS